MTVWTPKRITAFLHLWNLLAPLKIIITSSQIYIYAGVWGYVPGNPLTELPIVVYLLFYAAFMFPFYTPGIIIAAYVWRGFKNPNLTRSTYVNVIAIIQVVYILLIWVVPPCPISTHPPLCIPVPSTGIMAMLFVSKVVKKLDSPWTETDRSSD